MGRWTDISRTRIPRHWMHLEYGDVHGHGESSGLDVASLSETLRVLDRVQRQPWARGPRGPLRRNEGVPVPLETPLFVHHRAMHRARVRRTRDRRNALQLLAAAVSVGGVITALRVLLG